MEVINVNMSTVIPDQCWSFCDCSCRALILSEFIETTEKIYDDHFHIILSVGAENIYPGSNLTIVELI
jgi:hypothetical protein